MIKILFGVISLYVFLCKKTKLSYLDWFKIVSPLNLSGMGLTELPKTIEKLSTRLYELNINDNKLTGLPPRFSQLENIRSLNLGYNPLHEVPDVLQECKQLAAAYSWRILRR